MKMLIGQSMLAAVALVPAALYAQTTDAIVSGSATVILTPATLQQFTGLGVTLTDLTLVRLPNGTNVLPALQGAIDLTTSFNEVVYGGGYQFVSGSHIIQVRNLTLDLMGPSAIFYGIVIEDGTFVGREAIFSIVATGAPTLPIVPVNGAISHNGLNLSFQQPFLSLLNGAFGNTGLSATTVVGTLNLFSVLAPLTPVSRWPAPWPTPAPGPFPIRW